MSILVLVTNVTFLPSIPMDAHTARTSMKCRRPEFLSSISPCLKRPTENDAYRWRVSALSKVKHDSSIARFAITYSVYLFPLLDSHSTVSSGFRCMEPYFILSSAVYTPILAIVADRERVKDLSN
jgi:hypothetical protein